MKALVLELEKHMQAVYALRFFYSFQIPRLGKEFDLIQLKEGQILNLELKSGSVSDEAIRRQLLQNRYYLAALGKPIRSYTYISSQNRLVRLTKHDHIVEADWEQLCLDLQHDSCDYQGEIETLFQAELYLISPLTEPSRFLKKEYFLTYQQRDIERQILKKIRTDHRGYFSFTGLPGTGKTLLLYDIAMKLSGRQRVCVIHCGEAGREWKRLHERLRRVEYRSERDFLDEKMKMAPVDGETYSAILVDEAHLLSEEGVQILSRLGERCPVIFSSNCEERISPEERGRRIEERLEKLPGMQIFHLTNRIRANAELSYFIQNMLHLPQGRNQRRYPHIEVVYANEDSEAEKLLKGYIHLGFQGQKAGGLSAQEVERLAVVLDERYYYDEQGYLRSKDKDVRRLFYQLSEAKEELALVVKRNEHLYGILLGLL